MTQHIVFVGGSPSPTSRSSFVAGAVAKEVENAGCTVRHFSLHQFEPGDILFARCSSSKVANYIDAVKSASAIVLSTPVYKATYAGTLKALVDLIPQDALVGKLALGIATTRLDAHGRTVDEAYQSLFSFFRARALGSLVVLDEEFHVEGATTELATEAQERVTIAANALVAALVPTAAG